MSTRATHTPAGHSQNESEQVLDAARALVEQLEAGNDSEARRLLTEISEIRESSVFQEMGRLTRQLHDALSGFQLETRLQSLTAQDIPEARERLGYVVSMTEQAANQTLEMVEHTLPVSDGLRVRAGELEQRWRQLLRRELKPDEFRALSKELLEFFAGVEADGERIHANLSEVLLAQGYQDLTGQVLRKVITLVQEVEESLVHIIRVSAVGEDQASAPQSSDIQTEGSPIEAQDGRDVVSGQDEVDDLLSSLGF